MKISEQWLRETVPVRLSTKALAERLTMAGLEVSAVEPVAGDLDNIVIGEIRDVSPHPNADRLTICKVHVGKSNTLQIVCGANNVVTGIKVPVALPGARLANGVTIKKTTIRDVASSGMLCSVAELGLGESAEGLLAFNSDARPGQKVSDYMQLNDVTLEFDPTPNRGDCLSALGIAREIAALTGVRLKKRQTKNIPVKAKRKFNVLLEAKQDCPRYVGRVIEGIKADAVTPLWMQERLRRSGIRSIHPVVDITNYVMLEIGQPMHAFDVDKLDGRVVVRHARKNESLALLDGTTIRLKAGTLLIADNNKPLALAGIMGGLDSAVGATTHNLFLESAFFRPESISGVARSLGLQTDSSYRFERGVAPDLQASAMQRATALLMKIVGGKPGPVIERTAKKYLPARPVILLRHERVARILGHTVAGRTIDKILSGLGMTLKRIVNGWRVRPPVFRFDITREVDLIEEIARVYGYEKLTSTLPSVNLAMPVQSETKLDLSRIRDLLVDRDYQEVVTYSFVEPKLQSMIDPDITAVRLSNPISVDMSVMRTSLWPGLLQSVIYNQNRQQSRLRLFEVGRRFRPQGKTVAQEMIVAGAVAGPSVPVQWGNVQRDVDFFDVKADLQALLQLTGRLNEFKSDAIRHPALHPGQSAQLSLGAEQAGLLGTLHPDIQHRLELKRPVILFELRISAIERANIPVFRDISKYPAIRRDLAVVVDEAVPARAIEECIFKVAGTWLVKLELFDQYRGEGIDYGRKSLALGLTLQDSSRTLKEEEINSLMAGIISALGQELGAELRK